MPEPQPRPEFVADLRERLLLAAETELTPAPTAREREVARLTVKPTRTRRERRIALALGTVAVLGATTTMAYASQSAIPGDALYPLKRAIENTQTGFSRGDESKGEAILGNASVRLVELDDLTQQKNPDAQLVTQTLNTFTAQATDASHHLLAAYEQDGDAASIQQLHQFTQHSIDQLSALAPVIPHEAQAALHDAAAALMTIDAAATNLCPDCGSGVTELPPQLVAGAAHALAGSGAAAAGGQLDGATSPPTSAPQQGGKGLQYPSGLNPPETPIQVPTQPSASSNPLGSLLPSSGGGQTGSGGGSGSTSGSGSGGNGGKHHLPSVDVSPVTSPVTTAVNDVVQGVVDGVSGLLGGLTGDGGSDGSSSP